ncbi:MAG: hypothetical protein JKY65_14460 [Planctomycetes bacterium]|nr:hypothetical protein [Planctomycetota bacterium]
MVGSSPIRAVTLLALLVGGVLPAFAHDSASEVPHSPEEVWQPSSATHLGGSFGLTGFGTMIDGRIPSPLLTNPDPGDPLGGYSTRFSLRYDLLVTSRELRGAERRYRVRERRESFRAHYGLTVHGLDLSLGLPYQRERVQLGKPGSPEGQLREEGVGDVTLGAKLGLRIPEFLFGEWAVAAFAPYVLARIPSGADRLQEPAYAEAGLAIAGPYGSSFRWVGNFAFRRYEGGLIAGIYRFGASAVPLADSSRTLRVYLHVAGIEYEGRPNSDVDVEAGAQLLLVERVSVDFGLSYRLVDSGFVSRRLGRSLQATFGEVPRGWWGDRAFGVTFALGFVL